MKAGGCLVPCQWLNPVISLIQVLALFLLFVMGPPILYAQDRPIKVRSALPGEDCQTEPVKSWALQEKWAWNQICQGKTADFNIGEDYGGVLDPKKKDIKWPDTRVLSPAFLETVLLHEPYREAVTRHGIQITGAWFTKPLDLSYSTLTHEIALRGCRFESYVTLSNLKTSKIISLDNSKFKRKLSFDHLQTESDILIEHAELAGVDLVSAKIDGQVSMIGSNFSGKLNMNGIQVGRNLFMNDKATFAEVDLVGAKIDGQVSMIGSTFSGKLNMNGIQVGQYLLMNDKATFAEVDLHSAKIGDQLSMCGSTFSGKLNMNGIQVGQSLLMYGKAMFAEVDLGVAKIGDQLAMVGSTFFGKLNMSGIQVGQYLFMNDKATFAEVDLHSAKIGDQLSMVGSTFSGKLNMTGIQVGRNLLMHGKATFNEPLRLEFAKIGGNLELSGSTFNSIDLTGTQIVGDFVLDSTTCWLKDAELRLCSAEVGGLRYSQKGWPDSLDLHGFVYTRLGSWEADKQGLVDIKKWLAKQKKYSPQPYEQLAAVLEKQGYKDEAEEILYEGKNLELTETKDFFRQVFLSFLKVSIGYKYRIRYTVLWVVGFILLGMIVLRASKQGPANKMPYGIAYSLDMLLPIIRLRDKHYEIDLKGWARYYFYFHKIMGYVLASFLIVGLSGLTK